MEDPLKYINLSAQTHKTDIEPVNNLSKLIDTKYYYFSLFNGDRIPVFY